MKPAAFKTTLEDLGLTPRTLAALLDTTERTVRHWEAGRKAVPDDAVTYVVQLGASFDCQAQEIADGVYDSRLNDQQDPMALVRFHAAEDWWTLSPHLRPLPLTCHAAILARVRERLLRGGVLLDVIYMDLNLYGKWLHGRQDTEMNRMLWAGTHHGAHGRREQASPASLSSGHPSS